MRRDRHYFVAKKLADERLLASPVRSTILRPGRLTDTPGTGRVTTEVATAKGVDVSRENVAACIAASLQEPRARGLVIDLLDGDTSVTELFADSL